MGWNCNFEVGWNSIKIIGPIVVMGRTSYWAENLMMTSFMYAGIEFGHVSATWQPRQLHVAAMSAPCVRHVSATWSPHQRRVFRTLSPRHVLHNHHVICHIIAMSSATSSLQVMWQVNPWRTLSSQILGFGLGHWALHQSMTVWKRHGLRQSMTKLLIPHERW
jgi:hypothetical protein